MVFGLEHVYRGARDAVYMVPSVSSIPSERDPALAAPPSDKPRTGVRTAC